MGEPVLLQHVLAQPFDFFRLALAEFVGRQALDSDALQGAAQGDGGDAVGGEPEAEGLRRFLAFR